MKQISAINSIKVPQGMDKEAIKIRNSYVDYFSRQEGFVSSTFYKSITIDPGFTKYINIVVWDSYESFEKVVNQGFGNAEGINVDGLKVLGKGFPDPIVVSPGQYEIIGN